MLLALYIFTRVGVPLISWIKEWGIRVILKECYNKNLQVATAHGILELKGTQTISRCLKCYLYEQLNVSMKYFFKQIIIFYFLLLFDFENFMPSEKFEE